jgi:hypothetical protein
MPSPKDNQKYDDLLQITRDLASATRDAMGMCMEYRALKASQWSAKIKEERVEAAKKKLDLKTMVVINVINAFREVQSAELEEETSLNDAYRALRKLGTDICDAVSELINFLLDSDIPSTNPGVDIEKAIIESLQAFDSHAPFLRTESDIRSLPLHRTDISKVASDLETVGSRTESVLIESPLSALGVVESYADHNNL